MEKIDELMEILKGNIGGWPRLATASEKWNKTSKRFSPGAFLIPLSTVSQEKPPTPNIAEEEKEVDALFEDGVIPESEGKVVPYLVVEADGVSPALQKEQERRAEIKLGIAHEGWQQISKERYRLKEKSVCSGIMSGGRFWEGFSLTLARKYHLAQIGKLIVDGDGAPRDYHLPILGSDKTEARLDPFLYKSYTIADRVSQQYRQQDEAFYQRTIWNQASTGPGPSLGRGTSPIERHCPKAGDFTAIPRASNHPPCSGKDSEEHPWAPWRCLST